MAPAKPDAAATAASGAAEQRDRARAYRKDQAGSATIILMPEEDEGVLSPRGNADARATENRARARAYRQSQEGGLAAPRVVAPGMSVEVETSQDQARENRLKARGYREHGGTLAVGPDGIPLVSCKDTDNVAGRIGDDVQSGSLILIVRDGKTIKARCR